MRRLRHSHIVFIGLLCSVLSPVLGSYEHGGWPSTHDLYDHELFEDDYYESPSYNNPAPPITVHPHPGGGHSQGSYYHYHVPLVSQQQPHYQPSYHHDNSNFLWPLLLLLALPLLFLPLLPLLLLPLGISLLALLAPGGMMMMMMMMMMMGGGMMMRTDTISGRAFNEMRTFGDVILMDMSSLLSKYARSFDLDQCPQRLACEFGSIFYPENINSSTDSSSTAKVFTNMILDQYFPKGKIKRSIKTFEKAFWTGSTRAGGSCSELFQCHPTFKIYGKEDPWENGPSTLPNLLFNETNVSSSPFDNGNKPLVTLKQVKQKPIETFAASRIKNIKKKPVNYVYPSATKANVDIDSQFHTNNHFHQDNNNVEEESKQNGKTKRSHYNGSGAGGLNSFNTLPYGKYKISTAEDILASASSSALYSKMFGTPTIRS